MATANEKFRVVNELVSRGVVLVQLDARRPGVKVPGFLKDDPQLRLNFNHVRGRGDLVVNHWGIRETLQFKGSWFPVSVPWSAVYVAHLHDAEPKVFAEDMPEEMVQEAMERMQRAGRSLEELEEKRPRPLWKERAEEGSATAEPATQSVSSPRRGHLRLVK
jgi:stringent starvation protein B